MAKREEAVNMTEQFAEFKELKDIDKTTLISVLEESFRSVLSKMFGNDDNFDVIVNPDKGDCEIYQNLEVVEDGQVENPNKQISLTDAQADDDPDCEVGEEHTRKIDFAKFGRRAILNLRQTLASKILDLQKDAIYNKFKALEGQLVAGEVYQVWKREVLLLDEEKNELLLPKDEQIPTDIYRKGDVVRAVIEKVDNTNNNPKIIVSRTSQNFLRRLFEQEVPEIHDGLIVIRAVARMPSRAMMTASTPWAHASASRVPASMVSCVSFATRTSMSSTIPITRSCSSSAPSAPLRSRPSVWITRTSMLRCSCVPMRCRWLSVRAA